jgi:uncharacterized damage-inducible protein DinB
MSANERAGLVDVIGLMYTYNTWANERILARAAALTPAQYIAPGNASFSSVRDTLVHTMSGQAIWLSRWRGGPNFPWYDPNEYPDLETLRTRWRAIDAETHAFVAGLDEAALNRTLHYRNSQDEPRAYPLWQMMLHQVNHGTQHRSEVAALLTAYGHSPGAMDVPIYLDALSHR